jgi:membrane protease YdiL (CAAX protease family)
MEKIMSTSANMKSQMNTSKPRFPWLFLILAYGLTWLFWIPLALIRQDYQSSPFLLAVMFLGVFGPGIAGIILTYQEQGREGGLDFWHRAFDFRRIRPMWYALILLLWPAMHLLAIFINNWLGGKPPEFEFVKQAMSLPVGIPLVVILYLLQAGLEELGWRGYMLDRLQALWKPLTASLILGVCHAFWHLPTFWVVGTNQSRWDWGLDFWIFIAFVVASSIFSTWCYNDNRRSTLAVILLHTTANLALDTFLLPGTGERIFKVLLALGAVVIAAAWMLPSRKQKQSTPF